MLLISNFPSVFQKNLVLKILPIRLSKDLTWQEFVYQINHDTVQHKTLLCIFLSDCGHFVWVFLEVCKNPSKQILDLWIRNDWTFELYDSHYFLYQWSLFVQRCSHSNGMWLIIFLFCPIILLRRLIKKLSIL